MQTRDAGYLGRAVVLIESVIRSFGLSRRLLFDLHLTVRHISVAPFGHQPGGHAPLNAAVRPWLAWQA